MIEASTLFHAAIHYKGIALHCGVVTLPKLQAIVNKTAPKKARITDGDIIRAVTSRDGTLELDGWRIKVSSIPQVDRP